MRFLSPVVCAPSVLLRYVRHLRAVSWVRYFKSSGKITFVRQLPGDKGVNRRYYRCGRYFLVHFASGHGTEEAIEVRSGNTLRLRLTISDGRYFSRLKRLMGVR